MKLLCIKNCPPSFSKGRLYEVLEERSYEDSYEVVDDMEREHIVDNEDNFLKDHFVFPVAEKNLCYCSAEDGIVCGFCQATASEVQEDLYDGILKGKFVEPEELILKIKAYAEKETDVKLFAEKLIDYVFSHSFE